MGPWRDDAAEDATRPPTPAEPGAHGPAVQGTHVRAASPLVSIVHFPDYQPLTGAFGRDYHAR